MTATHSVSALRRLGFWLALLLLAGVSVIIWSPWKDKNGPTVPTAEVKTGEFVDYIQLRGEVRARSSTFIIAPLMPEICRFSNSVQMEHTSRRETLSSNSIPQAFSAISTSYDPL